MNEYEVIRGTVDGKAKYCRIPIRSKTGEALDRAGITEITAESILAMPHGLAVGTIDAIIRDWEYWMKRANELFVKWAVLYDSQGEIGQTRDAP